jgi:hypothetical protein
MTKKNDRTRERAEGRAASDEVRAWYARHLQPKLQRAAQSGRVPPASALALDRDMKSLLHQAGVDADRAGAEDVAAGSDPAASRMSPQVREIERLLQQLRALVREVERLRKRGAGHREIEPRKREIARLQWRLADIFRADPTRGLGVA